MDESVVPRRPAVELHEGFEASMAAGLRVLRDARRVSVLAGGASISEFGPVLLGLAADITERGGTIRVLAAGPVDLEVAHELEHVGVQVRILAESRELSIVVTDHEVLLHPMDTGPEDLLATCSVSLTSLVALTRFQLLFEHAWGRGQPALADKGHKTGSGPPK